MVQKGSEIDHSRHCASHSHAAVRPTLMPMSRSSHKPLRRMRALLHAAWPAARAIELTDSAAALADP
jgi:hypothetical protein